MTPVQTRASSFAVCAFAAALLALAGCGQEAGGDRPPDPGDKAVATVGGETVWASDVKREAVAQGLVGDDETLDASSDVFRQMLDEVIDEKLLAAEAVRRRLDKDPLAQHRLAAARERILGDMLVERVVNRAVTDQAVRTLYEQQLKQARPKDEIRARQIVTKTLPEAQAVKSQLASGAAFESLAMERSIDQATRFEGGDLGYFSTDTMPDAYGAALKDAKAGDLVGPFQVEGGYAVVQVQDRRPQPPMSLDEARPQIVRFLTYDQVRDLLKQLRDKSQVKVLLPQARAEAAPSAPAPAPAVSSIPAKPEARP
jgi:peptidyl-prolyl cis-trans isomerase C